MNRETELHFGAIPQINTQRSKFDESFSLDTTMNAADIVPLYVDPDVLPGQTIELKMSEVIRQTTMIHPTMDNAFIDIMAYFVPHRLTMKHWPNLWGESESPWYDATEYEVPQIEAPSGGWAEGTIADYMGLPTYVDGISVSALPFRAYAKVISDWYRCEALQYNCHVYDDDTTRTGSNGNNYVTDTELGGMPCKACKTADYFTQALPAPQKGPSVSIPLGTTANVKTAAVATGQQGDSSWPLYWYDTTTKNMYQPTANVDVGVMVNNGATEPHTADSGAAGNPMAPINLYADLSNATAATINQLRTAFAIQKYYEAAARSGNNRYIEYLKSVFGVTSSDARLQRSEYLGGKRIPLSVDQVLQTSSTDATSPQGNTAGYGLTVDYDDICQKSFEEHGTFLVLGVIRYYHTYQQGIHKSWSRKKWTDFYNPFFANLGEQAILNKEIYAQGTSTDDEAFGYQEAWAEYRYKQNRVTGMMRSNSPSGSLDSWHYADDYSTLPVLSDNWIKEDETNIDRTLVVSSSVSHQFIGNFYFDMQYTLPMPIYGMPGLIDHV